MVEVQDILELGLGWAWFVNDLRAFLPRNKSLIRTKHMPWPYVRDHSLRLANGFALT